MSEPLDFQEYRREHATSGQPVLRTMVVCDLADSTALIDRLGDRQAAALLRKHDRMTRALVDQYDGQEIDKTDGYLLLFERPTQAVAFALAYQRGLRYMSEAEEITIRARVGIHVGDVMMWENPAEDIARGAKPVEVEGLAKPVAARLATLARPQQILLSGVAATIARRGQDEIDEDNTDVMWKSHGRFHIRGVAEVTEVFEVGEVDVAAFKTPQHRAVAWKVLPWWRRPSLLFPMCTVLAAIAGAVLWYAFRPEPTLAFAARDWVVIADVQNHTGQSDYDNTIDTALRIGMQQSRYINVISTTKIQQTLSLMKRDENTKVTEKIGAEIALRNNARALIVPRIVNVGNRLQLHAQLVDPKTNRVIKDVTSVAQNEDDLVAAIDTLVRKLRSNLGETLSQIKSTSLPLEKVTTPNLEALRAYSLASQAAGHGDYHLSQDLLVHALKMDPGFASAYALQAANYVSLGQTSQAETAIVNALKNRSRLSPLERIKMQAQKATIYEPKTNATAAWKVLADLYPDDAAGANNVGLYYAAYQNDCTSALPYLKHAASLPQPMIMVSTYILGTCELSLGHEKQAINSLKTAYDNGFRGPFLALADAYVETRQYGKASAMLGNVPSDANTVVSLSLRRALVVADQGDLASAESDLRHGLETITSNLTDSKGWALRLDLVGVLWGQGKNAQAREQTRKDLNILLSMTPKEEKHLTIDKPTLIAAYSRWAARLGDEKLALRGIRAVSSENQLRGYPVRAQMVAVAQAEMALHNGSPSKAIRIASAADSHPLWELLEVLARANTAAGTPGARAAYQRVIKNRPLAFGEIYENELGICTRALQWNLSQLDAAVEMQKKDPAEASRRASIFLDHWHLAPPDADFIRKAKSIVNASEVSFN